MMEEYKAWPLQARILVTFVATIFCMVTAIGWLISVTIWPGIVILLTVGLVIFVCIFAGIWFYIDANFGKKEGNGRTGPSKDW